MSDEDPPDDGQRDALAEHLTWMMDFLHAHHEGEDAGLWPLVRSLNPSAGDLLDQMEHDHAQIAPRWRRWARNRPVLRRATSAEPSDLVEAWRRCGRSWTHTWNARRRR